MTTRQSREPRSDLGRLARALKDFYCEGQHSVFIAGDKEAMREAGEAFVRQRKAIVERVRKLIRKAEKRGTRRER